MRLLAERPRRRLGLTPMVDVVLLLLIFFMLATRFGQDAVIEIGAAGGLAQYSGPPRLVEVYPDELRLNGIAIEAEALVAGLAQLMAERADVVVMRPRDGADVQRLFDLMDSLRAAGLTQVVLSE